MTLGVNAPRLSFEERRSIAAALAEGRGFAEIARDLGRPRSTVSREVARNGGVHRYQAGRAQQATTWRARRRPGPHPAEPPPSAGGADTRDVAAFEERFAETMIRTGVPAMMARVLVLMFTGEAGDFTAAELVARLQVSPASISKAVGWLEGRGLIRRERRDRREHYLMSDDVWYRAWKASMESMTAWAEHTREGAALLGTDSAAGARMDTTSRFFQVLRHDMLQAAERWRRTLG
ncbi:GbsR/MarR family transcriptional regulator [Phytomonospora endophytica]|uniref:DNA-binding transcriptional regulator GbsR (MarR family) n=1 Tax=Phytomonospora endophytica TaxID=714109 RepID=A0A841FLG8_9ACTN|nr:helix-turn-helix domain-containing protein [Phytomonospora endophytica]MBB6038171.1 DNA-binding transcriptional regulator GbsR (MarR family) [Phytomonospora endophytica]